MTSPKLKTLLLTAASVVPLAPSASASEETADTSPRRHRPKYRLELELHAGGAFPREEDGLRPGPTAGAALLFRPSADWAFGPVYDHYWFDWHAQAAEYDDPGGSASMRVFGIANRLYMFERGRFEPYIQGTLGWAWVASSDKTEQCDDADGIYPELSVGFDVYTAPWFRLAPSVFATSGPFKFGGSCSNIYIPNDPPPEPSTGMMAGLRLGGTFVFGDRRRP